MLSIELARHLPSLRLILITLATQSNLSDFLYLGKPFLRCQEVINTETGIRSHIDSGKADLLPIDSVEKNITGLAYEYKSRLLGKNFVIVSEPYDCEFSSPSPISLNLKRKRRKRGMGAGHE